MSRIVSQATVPPLIIEYDLVIDKFAAYDNLSDLLEIRRVVRCNSWKRKK